MVYRLFVALADHAKVVDDGRILNLIRQVRIACSSSREYSERPRVTLAGDGNVAPVPVVHIPTVERVPAPPLVTTGHDGEQQEDYLWGV